MARIKHHAQTCERVVGSIAIMGVNIVKWTLLTSKALLLPARTRLNIRFFLPLTAYVAEYVTTNVSMSNMSSPLPLRSVNSWIVIHSRVDSAYPTRQRWYNYTHGFGSSSSGGNFWLGLEYMHLLTTPAGSTCRLRVEIQADANGKSELLLCFSQSVIVALFLSTRVTEVK